MRNQFNQSSMVWLAVMAVLHGIYLAGVYFFLTVRNDFNFNNNYHLIGILTSLTVLLTLALFVGFVEHYPQPTRSGQIVATQTYLAATLLGIFFAALPFIIYFLLLDDFNIQRRQILPGTAAFGMLVYAYWQRWNWLLAREGRMRRFCIVGVFVLLLLLILQLLTDLIPVAMGTGIPANSIYPI